MAFAKFLVCEHSNRWKVALRWGRPEDQPPLVGTHSLDTCWQSLGSAPASFVALELTEANLESVVQRLQDLRNRFPLARAVVMCDRALADCQWLVREAGAVHVAVSTREISIVIQQAQQHFSQVRPPEASLRQRIWDRLAWQET